MSVSAFPQGGNGKKTTSCIAATPLNSHNLWEIPDCLFLFEQCKLYTANLMNKLFVNENFDSVNVHFQSNTGKADSFLSRVMTERERPRPLPKKPDVRMRDGYNLP